MDGITIAAAVAFIGLIGSWVFLPANGAKAVEPSSGRVDTAPQSAKA
jgi:hypothetical protein